MAVELGVYEGYCTIAEADGYLVNDAAWLAASDDVKQEAIVQGRYYIDANYDYDLSQKDEVDDQAKYANALLASDYFANGKLFGDSEAAIKSEMNKADVVEFAVEYSGSIQYRPPSYGMAFTLMDEVATRKGQGSTPLTRV